MNVLMSIFSVMKWIPCPDLGQSETRYTCAVVLDRLDSSLEMCQVARQVPATPLETNPCLTCANS
jgi:hypothetical protein